MLEFYDCSWRSEAIVGLISLGEFLKMLVLSLFSFQVLPVGYELHACLNAFKEFASSSHARMSFLSSFILLQSSAQEDVESRIGMEREGNGSLPDEYDWKRCPPLLRCWRNLLRSIDAMDDYSICAMEAVNTLCLGALCLCAEGKK